MSDPTDEKIELLVRSVLAAVAARLVEVRTEIASLASEVDRRHREVLARLDAMEHHSALPAIAAAAVPMAQLDELNAPLRVSPTFSQLPVAVSLPPIPTLTTTPKGELGEASNDVQSEPIDMGRLADLLSERLGSLSLAPQLTPHDQN